MSPLFEDPVVVLALLLAVLAGLFQAERHPRLRKVFKVVPLLVFAYFVPTALSNLGVIPLQSPLYAFIKKWLLPASLLLITLSVDIPAILGLGRNVLWLFLGATATVILGGPLAYLLLGGFLPPELGEQAWKGLAALSGSWIGGGANFIAIGESVGADANVLSMLVVVDVAVASAWMAVLLYFAGKELEMDKAIGADRASLDELKDRIAAYQSKTARPATLPDLLTLAALAFGFTAASTGLAKVLPDVGTIINGFTWVVILITAAGVGLSFTRLRRLEGAGASAVGSVFLYLLVASIGAQAEFHRVAEAPGLALIGAAWMLFHAVVLLLLRRRLRAPVFFLAVGSQANIGGAASAPIVASAFHPALAPVGVLLAVGGYVLGTYGGLLCAALLQQAHAFLR